VHHWKIKKTSKRNKQIETKKLSKMREIVKLVEKGEVLPVLNLLLGKERAVPIG
jgi:hypothetical protein